MKFKVTREEIIRHFPHLKGNFIDIIFEGEKVDDKRTNPQNNSLHLLFQQTADKCNEKGISFFNLVKNPLEVECTPDNIKWIWKKLQEFLFKTKSTTELKKIGEIEVVYRNFNKLLIDRSEGEVCLPPFPHEEKKEEKLDIEYPENNLEDITEF